MLDLNQMAVFVRVVQERSFTAAAKVLGMPKSRVSRMITDLEEKLGMRLLQRTTREVHPTDVGQQYFEQYEPLFDEIHNIHSRILDDQTAPSGLLKVAAPVGFAVDLLGRWNAEFLSRYPKIELELEYTDREVNLVREGFDCGFVVGELQDSSLIARRLDDTDPIICATTVFLQQYPAIKHPADLHELPWVKFGTRQDKNKLTLIHRSSGEEVQVKLNPRITVNHHHAAMQHTLADQGLLITSVFFSAEEMLKGKLTPVLPDWAIKQEEVCLVFPSGRYISKKLRAFVDFYLEKTDEFKDFSAHIKAMPAEKQAEAISQYMQYHSLPQACKKSPAQ